MKALSKSVEDRWSTAHEMLTALEDAMPLALEQSFELQVGAYMNELLGTRAAERRTQLRLAQQLADRLHADSTRSMIEPSSLGSLRTVSVEGGTGRSLRVSDEIVVDHPASTPVVGLAPPSPSSRRVRLAFGVATAAVLVALAAAQFNRQNFALHGSAAAARPTEAITMVAPPSLPAVELSPPPKQPPAPASPSSANAPSVPGTIGKEPARVTRKPQPAPRQSAGSSPNSAAGSSALTSGPEASHPDKSDAGKANAWDTETFGGRR
jgi:hypothetical protein